MAAYDALTPSLILDAIESRGFRCDGRLFAMNSFENRVYQAWLEDGASLVAKFYRPRRWSNTAIREEHAFALELAAREIPVVAPLPSDGDTLFEFGGYHFALYPKRPGRTPELEDPDTLRRLGRFIARIHAVGGVQRFEHRRALDIENFGRRPARYVLDHDFVPADLEATYKSVVDDVLDRVETVYERAGRVAVIRVHGDCHAGNILWTEEGPHFVDLDDTCMAPAIQDMWMWLSGERESMQQQLASVLEGYREFNDFDPLQLTLIESLRTLRLIHYSGWLAQRWDDPTFPLNFPFFNTQRYWQDQILSLREQAAALDELPLEI